MSNPCWKKKIYQKILRKKKKVRIISLLPVQSSNWQVKWIKAAQVITDSSTSSQHSFGSLDTLHPLPM